MTESALPVTQARLCKLTYIAVPPGAVGKAFASIEAWLKEVSLQGHLLGCMQCEIGALNRIVLIHGYGDTAGPLADQALLLKHADPYGVSAYSPKITSQVHELFPNSPDLAPGAHGPCYEIRTYTLKSGGVTPTFAAWKKVLEQRMAVSPLFGVMYSLDGDVNRFVHIWPYADYNQRFALRAKSVELGVWPPPGGIDHLLEMRSEIFLPAPFSPLR